MLAELIRAPGTFAERARQLSNCPSGADGSSLGQFGPGQMVAEFDAAIFGKSATGVLPHLVATRHGFHIVLVERRIAGRTLPFEAVEAPIVEHLRKRVQQRAMHQYVQLIARQAGVTDAQLGATTSPLVQ